MDALSNICCVSERGLVNFHFYLFFDFVCLKEVFIVKSLCFRRFRVKAE